MLKSKKVQLLLKDITNVFISKNVMKYGIHYVK